MFSKDQSKLVEILLIYSSQIETIKKSLLKIIYIEEKM